ERVEESKFRPIYPATARLPSDKIHQIVDAHLDEALHGIEEWHQPALLAKRGLIKRVDAYRAIHRPTDMREAMSARRRIVYDELLLLQLALGLSKRIRDGKLTAPVLRVDKLLDERIRRRFPFDLTNAQ